MTVDEQSPDEDEAELRSLLQDPSLHSFEVCNHNMNLLKLTSLIEPRRWSNRQRPGNALES